MLKYRPEIDGLRTIAIIPVIIFHLGYDYFKGGYMGVDMFFVISGYLMTRIILSDINNGVFSIYQFWLRRIRRIVPLLLTVVFITFVFAHLFLFKPVIKDISSDAIPAVFSYFNFHALFNFGSYWGGQAEQSFFLHTWSLSIEEQFYVLYPILLYIFSRYFRYVFLSVLMITAVSFICFIVLLKVYKNSAFPFFMLPARIWEFTVGALIVFINVGKFSLRSRYSFLPITGICLIGYSFLFGSSYLGLSVIFPVTGTALLLLFCSSEDVIGKLLSTKLFVTIGKLSYSLYLWHLVVIIFFKNIYFPLITFNQHVLNGLILFIIIILSLVSYFFIEKKTRNNLHTPKLVLVGLAVVSGLSLFYKSAYFNPHYKPLFNQQTSYMEYYDVSPVQDLHQANLRKHDLYYNVLVPERLHKFRDAYQQDGIISKVENQTPEIVLLGDSHGVMWAKLLNDIADENHVSFSSYASNGSMPFFNLKNIDMQTADGSFTQIQRTAYARSVINNLKTWKPSLVVLACRWSQLYEWDYLKQLLSYLERTNTKTLLLTQPPVLHFMENRNASQFFSYLNFRPVNGFNSIEVFHSEIAKNNMLIKKIASGFLNVVVYDAYANMIENDKVIVSLNNDLFYFDDDHLSYQGTKLHKDSISFLVKKMIAEKFDKPETRNR